ncbi:hypothetical protein AUR64_14965 [Haloprofundus marisrubri]|uniref:Uncharacterized protein n=1 Tax=Haloprofundus marisrubri TaxID=1514971 RepID=A0A0W1R6S5_9EURY|nr:SHOCT domain-containing protein [Haloprofundus marisrubri]KTG09096.1 hypothetical protein AUR64_14965 [Haloprofundus marisrubri]
MNALPEWSKPAAMLGSLLVMLVVVDAVSTVVTSQPLVALLALAVLGLFGVVTASMSTGFQASAAVANAIRDRMESEDETTESDAYEALKRRYADGDIDEAEFERRLGYLLETDEDHRELAERETELSAN